MVICAFVIGLCTGLIFQTNDAYDRASLSELQERIEALEAQVADQDVTINDLEHSGAIYRWAIFSTYNNNTGWLMNNGSDMFGGINPSNWTDGNAIAASMSPDKEILRTLYTRKGYGGKNALVMAKVFHQYSSTNGQVVSALFRIENTTSDNIIWTPYFYYTCYYSWSERASVALNGVNQWDSGSQNCMALPSNGFFYVL